MTTMAFSGGPRDIAEAAASISRLLDREAASPVVRAGVPMRLQKTGPNGPPERLRPEKVSRLPISRFDVTDEGLLFWPEVWAEPPSQDPRRRSYLDSIERHRERWQDAAAMTEEWFAFPEGSVAGLGPRHWPLLRNFVNYGRLAPEHQHRTINMIKRFAAREKESGSESELAALMLDRIKGYWNAVDDHPYWATDAKLAAGPDCNFGGARTVAFNFLDCLWRQREFEKEIKRRRRGEAFTQTVP